MALSANTIWDIRTTGSDTANGGAFDPSQTAGMFTDGAATSATGSSPVFSSASYNFVAGDVGAWVYIASGTNWTPGWYQIASVASNQATLSAAIGAAIQGTVNGVNTRFPDHASTAAGCATTASPTAATWTIDYSQQATAQFSYTDLASVGAGLLVSSVAKPFAKQQVGNSLVITGGTNFTVGRYVIVSVAAGVATVVGPGNITTGAGVSGTGGLGGCLASPGQCGAAFVGANLVFVVSGVTYNIASATINVATGTVSNVLTGLWVGWATHRHLQNMETAPTLQFSVSGVTMFADRCGHYNLIIDGNSQTSGIYGSGGSFSYCTMMNLTGVGAGVVFNNCLFTVCSAIQVPVSTSAYYCEAYGNTATVFAGACFNCLSYGNSGASTDGFTIQAGASGYGAHNTAYNNGRDGFRFTGSGRGQTLIGCHAEGNAGFGYNPNASMGVALIGCSDFNNTSGRVSVVAGLSLQQINPITLTSTAFTNAAGNDLSLSNTAGGGAAIRGQAGAFPRGTTTGYLDVGAVQHADPAQTGTFGGWESFGYPIPSRPAMIPGS